MDPRNRRWHLVIRAVLLFLFAATANLSVPAQVVKKRDTDLDKLTMTKRELRLSRTLTYAEAVKAPLPYRENISSFRSQYGREWRFLIDERIGRPNLVEGGAVPFIPGAANRLQWQDFAKDCDRPSCIPRSKMESLARDFLTRNRVALQINPDELVLDPVGTVPVGNSVYFMRFQWVYGGIPVEGGSVFLAINNGNLIQVGVTNIGEVKVDPKPTVPLEKAWEVLKSYVHGMDQRDRIINRGSVSIIPITPTDLDPDSNKVPFGKMISYVLVYRLSFQRKGVEGTWEALVDAHTAELLRFRDSNVYGHIKGGIYKTDVPHTEVTEPFAKTDYGAGVFTDQLGDFPGVTGTSTMTGLNTGNMGVSGGVTMSDTCGGISLTGDSIGSIDFGNQGGAGTDCTTPGFGGAGNTHAARTQDWNVTQIKMKAISYLPSNTWLQGTLTDTVNINQACNAFWDGSALNFFRVGTLPNGPGNYFGPFDQTCGNTGELPGVSLHEWGHGMDQNDGSGGLDNEPVEARADWSAILQTHQSCAGGGFSTARSPNPTFGLNCTGYGNPCTACTGIRDVDYAQHSTPTPWTPQNFNTVWGPGFMNECTFGGGSPCGLEDHCESGIATQALWDFVNRDLVAAPTNLDINTAWQLEDRLFYTGMPQSTNMYTCTLGPPVVSNGCGAGSLYTLMRAVDDDGDGVANGTPHAAAIFAALKRHGIACGAAADTANQNQTLCPSLTTPTLTATANNSQTSLNWTSGGANATRYFVLRNETSCSAGFTKVATVSAPTLDYTDSAVVHGSTYYYRVQAATANDSCVSAMSNCATVAVQLPADQDFYVRDWTDNPGSHDNGEEPSTNYSYNWAYSSDVWNRGVNNPGTPNADDWYPTDNMYAGTGTLGDNHGFVRVSRNSTGSAAAVTAEFLISPFGVGSNFGSVATTTLNFGASHATRVKGAYWHQDPTASTHACIAVEISTTGDPYQSDLAGHSPGDPDGQSLIVIDNNKAQRNLGVSLNVPHFAGIQFALIHNPALYARNVVLRYDSPARDHLQGAEIQVVGGRTEELHPGGTIELENMQPGENRWIAVKYQLPTNDPVPIHFLELDHGNPLNAFTILAQPASLNVVIHDNLVNHVQVFNRLGAALGIRGAKLEADAAEKLAREKEVSPARYLAYLKQHFSAINSAVEPFAQKEGAKDAFGVLQTLKELGDAVSKNQLAQVVSAHGILLRCLDSFSTMLQKAKGDPADILQMVRWQKKLYSEVPELKELKAAHVVDESQEFIDSYGKRKQKEEDYQHLLGDLLESFHDTAEALEKQHVPVEREVKEIEDHLKDTAALEKAHRNYLLQLQTLVK